MPIATAASVTSINTSSSKACSSGKLSCSWVRSTASGPFDVATNEESYASTHSLKSYRKICVRLSARGVHVSKGMTDAGFYVAYQGHRAAENITYIIFSCTLKLENVNPDDTLRKPRQIHQKQGLLRGQKIVMTCLLFHYSKWRIERFILTTCQTRSLKTHSHKPSPPLSSDAQRCLCLSISLLSSTGPILPGVAVRRQEFTSFACPDCEETGWHCAVVLCGYGWPKRHVWNGEKPIEEPLWTSDPTGRSARTQFLNLHFPILWSALWLAFHFLLCRYSFTRDFLVPLVKLFPFLNLTVSTSHPCVQSALMQPRDGGKMSRDGPTDGTSTSNKDRGWKKDAAPQLREGDTLFCH